MIIKYLFIRLRK